MPVPNTAGSLFTSESVTEGHPDKIADAISDAALTRDRLSRVACETLVTTGMVVLAGEITTPGFLDFTRIVRNTVNRAQGVGRAREQQDALSADGLDSAGAGDQGMVFGYATNETPELMPMPIASAHRLARRLPVVCKDGTLDYLCPDGKTQVTIRYRGEVPVGVERVLVSSQHAEETVDPRLIEQLVSELFDLRPAAFRQSLHLHRPIHSATAAYGHFGRVDVDLPWERTDRAVALGEAAGLAPEAPAGTTA